MRFKLGNRAPDAPKILSLTGIQALWKAASSVATRHKKVGTYVMSGLFLFNVAWGTFNVIHGIRHHKPFYTALGVSNFAAAIKYSLIVAGISYGLRRRQRKNPSPPRPKNGELLP